MILVLTLALFADVANANYIIGTPINLGQPVNSSADDWGSSISSDGLELYLESNRPGGEGGYDIWVSKRVTKEDDWGAPTNLGSPINTSAWETMPRISTDGLALYFTGPDGSGGTDLLVTTRETVNDEWGSPVNLGPTVNSTFFEGGPAISSDGLDLYFVSDRPGGLGSFDLWVTTRATLSDPWGEAVNLGPTINSSVGEWYPSISADGLVLFFQDDNLDLCRAQRKSTTEPFGPVVQLPSQINTSRIEGAPSLSYDGSTLYFASNNSGGYGQNDIWQASIDPIVDFDGSGMVDINDLVIMIENWDTNEPSCDIGPMPWGDGIVDRADLEVLMEYYNQVIDALAYYKLDETEGDIAFDSSGNYCAANAIGDLNWQPEGGILNGALEFDGIDDYISTPFILNPGETSAFSVFAWIKGGLPGQVIISQANSADWLSTDAEGHLMTELKGGRGTSDLISEVVITDGDWHRVGFTWDGDNRILYVDDVIAAIDILGSLQSSEGGLYIGAGKDPNIETGIFWSGLIDDVRIYERVITP